MLCIIIYCMNVARHKSGNIVKIMDDNYDAEY